MSYTLVKICSTKPHLLVALMPFLCQCCGEVLVVMLLYACFCYSAKVALVALIEKMI